MCFKTVMLVAPHKKGFLPPRETRSGNNEGEVEKDCDRIKLSLTHKHIDKELPFLQNMYNTTQPPH